MESECGVGSGGKVKRDWTLVVGAVVVLLGTAVSGVLAESLLFLGRRRHTLGV